MWIIRPLEIKILDAHTGKFRLTAQSDEDGGGPFGLCNHEHDSPDEASECPDARERSYVYGGIRPETREAYERAEYERLKGKYDTKP